MVKGEGGAMKKKVDVDLHDIVQNLPLKAAKGEIEADEKYLRSGRKWIKGAEHKQKTVGRWSEEEDDQE